MFDSSSAEMLCQALSVHAGYLIWQGWAEWKGKGHGPGRQGVLEKAIRYLAKMAW